MLLDAREFLPDQTLQTDLCIVGAGAAGITLAREFVSRRFSVYLLESGGFEFDDVTQSLYQGQSAASNLVKSDYVSGSRLRYFGGSTNHWTGLCRALDDSDFKKRSWVPYSGWPFPKSHLVPFYRRAASICQLNGYPDDSGDDQHPTGQRFLFDGDGSVVNKLFYLSAPTRFGVEYRNQLIDSSRIQVCLHANVVEIVTNRSGSNVESLEVQTLAGNRFWVRAKMFVLASGGIENARLLLQSDRQQSGGLGNQNDLVGRFFMEHPLVVAGALCFYGKDGVSWDALMGNSEATRGILSTSEDAQQRSQLLNFSLEAYPLAPRDTSRFIRSIGRVALQLDKPKSWQERELESALLVARGEQSPNPESRVSLIAEKDLLGKRRVLLDWRLSSLDRGSIIRSIEIVAKRLGQYGWGRAGVRMGLESSWLDAGGSNHHMGTTRMHTEPRQGVVDADCRVHSVSNLYIAGSSVFPIVGFANPTLTLVALALRLAECLKERLGRP